MTAPHVACLWLRDAATETREYRVLPDACADVVWIAGRGLHVAGPATGPVHSDVPAGAAVMGVRFRVGAAGAALGLPAQELLDGRVGLEDLWGREAAFIAERVAAAATPAAQLTVLADEVRARTATDPDPIVRAAAHGAARPGARVERLAAELGIGDRHLRRGVAAAVGYGPKTLHRVLRFQRFLALATAHGASTATANGPHSATAHGASTTNASGPANAAISNGKA